MKKTGLLIALGALAFVAILTWLTLGGRKHRVEVCMEYRGQRNCRVASGATREAALRTAVDNACALIAGGVTETMQCTNSRPASVRDLE